MPTTIEQDWTALDSLEQSHLAKQVRRGDLTCILPMIVKISNESWVRLPPHTRVWFSKADSLTTGIEYTVTHVAWAYDKKRGVKFSTFLFDCLTNFYITKVSEPFRAAKRWEGGTISFDTGLVRIDPDMHIASSNEAEAGPYAFAKAARKLMSVEAFLFQKQHSTEFSIEDETIARVDSQKHFMKVYDAATPSLRKYLIRWFLTTKVIHTKDGEEYRSAKRELRKLAKLHTFTFEMAKFLNENDPARMNTAIEILKRYKTSQVFSKKRIIEYEEMVIQ